MNLNSDNSGNYRQGFTTAVMINGFNYCAENISAVTKSGIANPGGRVVEGTKQVIDITANEGVDVNTNIEEVTTKTVVNTVVNVGVGKVTDAGSKKAVQNANKEVATAKQKLKTAERQAQRSPNSAKKAENANNAQSNVQSARNKQVRTQMLNSTVGQSPNATQKGATTVTNRASNNEEKNKEK